MTQTPQWTFRSLPDEEQQPAHVLTVKQRIDGICSQSRSLAINSSKPKSVSDTFMCSTYIWQLSKTYLLIPGWASLNGSVGKESACNARDLSSILAWEDPLEKEITNPIQYSCLENLMDRGDWQAAVPGVPRVRRDLMTKPPPPLLPG